jgi:hypothetical protein
MIAFKLHTYQIFLLISNGCIYTDKASYKFGIMDLTVIIVIPKLSYGLF